MQAHVVPAAEDGFGCVRDVSSLVVVSLESDYVFDGVECHDCHELHFPTKISGQQFETLKSGNSFRLDSRPNLLLEHAAISGRVSWCRPSTPYSFDCQELLQAVSKGRYGSNADAPRLDIATLSVGSSGSLGAGHTVFHELLPVSGRIGVVDRVFYLRLDEHRKALRKGRWLGSPPVPHPGE